MPMDHAAAPNAPAQSTSRSLARVLVPLDGSDAAAQALPLAAAIAAGTAGGAGAEIVLLAVTPPAANVRNILGQEIAPAARVQEGYAQVATARLEAAAAALPPGLATRTVVATGDPTAEILRVAAAEGAGLIALSASGGGAWGPSAFGRVTDRVVRAAPSPVLVVPPRPVPGARITGILVPIDGSAASFAALPVAAALAGSLGVGVRVVQAVSYRPETESPPPSPPAGGIAHPDTIEREFRGATRAAAEAAVAEALARLQSLGVAARGDILTGNPVAAVISDAGRTDLVVLTGRGEGHGQGDEAGSATPPAPVSWTIGGVADKLLRAGTTPLVLVPGR